jgi:hypothetical protein
MMTKLERMTWAGHVVRWAKREIHSQIQSENLTGTDYFEDVNLYVIILLKWLWSYRKCA